MKNPGRWHLMAPKVYRLPDKEGLGHVWWLYLQNRRATGSLPPTDCPQQFNNVSKSLVYLYAELQLFLHLKECYPLASSLKVFTSSFQSQAAPHPTIWICTHRRVADGLCREVSARWST